MRKKFGKRTARQHEKVQPRGSTPSPPGPTRADLGRPPSRAQGTVTMALRNMLDGDGQDQFDAGGWCFPKPIPPVQRNGDWIVSARGRAQRASVGTRVDVSHRRRRTLAGHGPHDAR